MAQKAGGLVYAAACGDCRDIRAVRRLLGGRKVNLVVTSPPYASQRKYDPSSGFRPIAPDEYVAWFKDVADVIADGLTSDGSYFLNIKEHAQDGERSLYVKDLVLAHARQWGWRFVDEFCWRNTANGVPGGWPNRFKNAWEPVFHFSRSDKIKFRPDAVSHASDDVVVYSPSNPKAPSGSGLLGCGADKVKGMARPSNVIEVKAEGGQSEHSAPYPRALVEFFIKAFTDPGDAVFDPFLGSASTMVAAMALGRSCFGMEISPGYCDVAVQRAQTFAEKPFLLAGSGATFEQVKMGRRLGTEETEPSYSSARLGAFRRSHERISSRGCVQHSTSAGLDSGSVNGSRGAGNIMKEGLWLPPRLNWECLGFNESISYSLRIDHLVSVWCLFRSGTGKTFETGWNV
jgi:DNA modification methylase